MNYGFDGKKGKEIVFFGSKQRTENQIGRVGFDKAVIQICYQGELDHLSNFNIFARNIDFIRSPLKSRSMYKIPVDYEKYQPNSCQISIQRVIYIFKHTTQKMMLSPLSFLCCKFKLFLSFMNFPRQVEYSYNDILYSNVKIHTIGVKLAHIFTGFVSNVMNAFGVKNNSSAEFLSSFQHETVKRVVPSKLVANNAPLYRSNSAIKYLVEL